MVEHSSLEVQLKVSRVLGGKRAPDDDAVDGV
jgi:hypothetical protein